jgi:hypothetical protein
MENRECLVSSLAVLSTKREPTVQASRLNINAERILDARIFLWMLLAELLKD